MTRKQQTQRARNKRWKDRIRKDPVRYRQWLDYHRRYKREHYQPRRPLPLVSTYARLPKQPWEG